MDDCRLGWGDTHGQSDYINNSSREDRSAETYARLVASLRPSFPLSLVKITPPDSARVVRFTTPLYSLPEYPIAG